MALDLGRFMVRFVEEARDHIGRLNDGIARLETESSDREAINAIFRSAHTIKGSSRMLRLVPITETAHGLEDVLGALREGVLRFDPQLAQVLYRGVDAISALVDRLAETRDGTSLPPAQPDICASLARAVAKVGQASDADGPREDAPLAKPVELAPTLPADPAAALDALRSANLPTHGLGAARSQDTVRVRLDKLDELINLMGELVSHHARLRQRCIDLKGLERELVAQAGVECGASLRGFAQRFRDDVQAQDVLMSTLHDKALVMRMLPLAIIFEPAGRMMRELARSVGKEVEFVIRGSEIELDRQVIDRLADPVVHLLRNALDHGLELPQKRIALGKPAQGRLSLLARQDGDSVVIEVGDDGAGIPLEGVREKSVKRGMVAAEKAAALTEDELIELLFRPGFSTAAIITDLSGRGVGLDVVRQTVIDELSGEVSVKTVAGKGTSFTLSLPLSLAVVRVLLVEVGGRPFGFGAPHVSELLRVPVSSLMQVAERNAVIVRNEFVPVMALADLLQVPTSGVPARAQVASKELLLLVLRVRNDKIAVVVDALIDECDMVIKPLPAHMRRIALVAGVVVTGRNMLASVIHVPALMGLARTVRSRRPLGDEPSAAAELSPQRILVVDDSLNTRELEKDVLEAHGYLVSLAEDGAEGLAKALAGDFDAVLTDVEMPSMDGFTLTARLREDDRYRNRPILIITSREKEEDKRRGMQVGADAYIVKGDFDQHNLVDTLRALLG